MSESYQLLRFELPSLSLFFYLAVLISPFVFSVNQDQAIKVATLMATFLAGSLAVGYVIHQFWVNVYRSQKKARTAHKFIRSKLESHLSSDDSYRSWTDEEKFIFEDSLLGYFFCVEKWKPELLNERLSSRWSHLYARRAVGTYTLGLAGAVVALIVLINLTMGVDVGFLTVDRNRGVLAIIIFISLFITLWVMNNYVKKLIGEISMMEMSYLVENNEAISEYINQHLNGATIYYH